MMFGPMHNRLGHFFDVLALHLDPGGCLGLSLSVTFHGDNPDYGVNLCFGVNHVMVLICVIVCTCAVIITGCVIK